MSESNNRSYLVKFKPLEPYFFGGEKTFDFGEQKQQSRSRYYIKSEEFPAQTTLLGTLRYLLLDIAGELSGDYTLSDEAKDLIGGNSFSFTNINGISAFNNKFGVIKKLSPVFLLDKEGNYCIKTPFNHKNYKIETADNKKSKMRNSTFTPLSMKSLAAAGAGAAAENAKLLTSNNCSLLPENYNPKEDYQESYTLLLQDGQAKIWNSEDHDGKPLFFSKEQIGIKTHRNGGDENNDDSFFKKEYKILHKDYCFACFVTLEDNDKLKELQALSTDSASPNGRQLQSIVYMGQGKSAFEVTVSVKENNLEEQVKTALETALPAADGKSFYYALSDIKLPQGKNLGNYQLKYCIAKTRHFRNLETNYNNANYYSKLKKSQNLYRLIRAGSVFYTDAELNFDSEADCQDIGFNCIVEIKKK